MDLWAYSLKDKLVELLPSEPPRLRGIRLMILEKPTGSSELELYDSFCGKDVIYIHTRCGQCHYDGDDNYEAFGMDIWEDELGEDMIAAENDDFDCTYRDTYIRVPNESLELYYKLVEEIKPLYSLTEVEESEE
jgi:hypothetical protein